MHSQQNSAPHTLHVIWLQEPSSIFIINTWHLGHDLTSSSKKYIYVLVLDSVFFTTYVLQSKYMFSYEKLDLERKPEWKLQSIY